ncbi:MULTISPECIES: N-acetylmuramoyl-L-alanine amidase [unclassified Oscillibacter]|uniref:N-acetylmuramoyl-L-alanine amidase n=1 Tax=unclassified Oscillibacter TaxID=2629304 RepID=UPI0003AE5995|nr:MULTISPECIES: N-acetylmuramoyl-L-alanine amidase [unclassified Oscillibacter]ERK63028.1 N-acetylmuramoyl-L-alanine amidase [Oscillibacter sp. KLE 1745]ERK65098.1 N-acetylmuramoyl-L-alanine amidase [Oscillibacter sp. KLE 1728]
MSYTLKEQLANSGNYGGSRAASQIKYLIFHYTGNDGDKAANNAAYFQQNIVKASAHYFVDDTTVWRSVPDLKVAWAVGGSKYPNADKTGGGTMHGIITNTNSISIEMCDTIRNGVYQASEATLANAAALGRELMAKYGIPLERVYRHFDVTGKHCPSYLVNAQKWAEFKKRLEVKIMDNAPSPAHKEGVEWAIANGIMTGNGEGDLMLSQPVTRQQMCTMLHRLWELIERT